MKAGMTGIKRPLYNYVREPFDKFQLIFLFNNR
jgi:hypothetical protein